MKLRPGEPLRVTLAFGSSDALRVGRLALDRRFIAAFEYDRSYLAARPSIYPL